MKKILLLILASMGLISFASHAADKKDINSLKTKTVNVRIFVPGLFVGWLDGAVDFKVSPAITVGPTMKYFAFGPFAGYSIGAEMNYALNGDVFSSNSWLLNPYAGYYQSNYASRKQASTALVGANLMYQWIWEEGINLQLGMGLAFTTVRLPVGIGGSHHIIPNFDFSIGYAF